MTVSNPLTDILPASVRRYVYALWALIGLVLGAVQAFGSDPSWLPGALAVYAFVSTAIGVTAASNTPKPQE